ncbi:hypothetical protein RYX36_014743 [Vicia faba]
MVVISEETDPYAEEGTETEIESVDYEELKKRMWKDKILLQKFKEKEDNNTEPEQQAKQEASRRKKMARAQDSVLKYMAKIMDVCKAKGFVYGIIPEKGKPVSGSSDSLREWWKDQIRFDQSAPLACFKMSISEEGESSGGSSSSSRSEKRKCVFDVGGDDAEFPQNKLPLSFANLLDCEARIENNDEWLKMGDTEGGRFGWDVEHWLNEVDDHELEAALEMVKDLWI